MHEPKQEPETGRVVEVFNNLVSASKALPAAGRWHLAKNHIHILSRPVFSVNLFILK